MSQIPSASTIAARRARDRYPRCPYCPSTDVTGTHVDRCADTARYRQAVLDAAAAANIPEAVALDLWAHARSRTTYEHSAALVVQMVIDMGWRPVVGTDPRQLWPRESEVEWAVVDDGRVIHIAGAQSPADALAGAHGHGTHGPIGVAHRTVTRTPWQHLEETTDG